MLTGFFSFSIFTKQNSSQSRIIKFKSFNQGLTLIELLTVVAIMVLMSAIVFGNYNNGNDSLSLDRASQKLAQDFRRVVELSLSGSESTYASCGIYFNSSTTQYQIYGNPAVDDTNAYDTNAPTSDTIIETIKIEKGIKICSITGGQPESVVAIPPMPNIYVNGVAATEFSVVLAPESDTACTLKTKTIKINGSGRVDIN